MKPISIKWVLAHEPIEIFIRAAEHFAKVIEEKAPGQVNIEILRSALPKILFLCFLLAIIIIIGKTLIVNLKTYQTSLYRIVKVKSRF